METGRRFINSHPCHLNLLYFITYILESTTLFIDLFFRRRMDQARLSPSPFMPLWGGLFADLWHNLWGKFYASEENQKRNRKRTLQSFNYESNLCSRYENWSRRTGSVPVKISSYTWWIPTAELRGRYESCVGAPMILGWKVRSLELRNILFPRFFFKLPIFYFMIFFIRSYEEDHN